MPPHSTVHVDYTAIVGYEAGETEATLMQWRLERQLDGRYRSRDFQSTTLGLH